MRVSGGFIICLILAVLVRIALVFISSEWRPHPDVLRYKDWAQIAYLHGFNATYSPEFLTFGTYPNNQPPGSVFVLTLGYQAWLLVGKALAVAFSIPPGSNPWVNVVLLHIFLRLPSVLCDLVIITLIYAGVLRWRKSTRDACVAAAVFSFNPIVLFNSTIWGQMDAVNNLSMMLAMYFLLIGKTYTSLVFAAVSILVKSSLLIWMPLYALCVWFQTRANMRQLGIYILVFLGVMFVGIMSVSMSPFTWYGKYLTTQTLGEMTNITAFAFNLWWVIFHPTLAMGPSNDITKVVDISLIGSPLSQSMMGPLSLGAVATIITIVVQLPIYIWVYIQVQKERKISPKLLFTALTAIAIICFHTLPHMHERYLYPAVAPMALLIGLGVPIGIEFIVLSLLNLINLLAVWHPMPFDPWVFDIVRNDSVQWTTALLTTIVSFWIVYKLCFRNYSH
jgi:Gpi18-like mannosyltransferase